MPASRWNSNLLEMLNWLKEEEASIEEFLLRPIQTHVGSDEHADGDADSEKQTTPSQIPTVLAHSALAGSGRISSNGSALDHWTTAFNPPCG